MTSVLNAPTFGSGSPGVTMAQGPVKPWSTDAEAEEYARDPRKYILERTADWINNIEIFHNIVVVATYVLPAFHVLASGKRFYRADSTLEESQNQGKVGLVLAKGPLAFRDSEGVQFLGQNIEIGDWIWYDIHAGRQLAIRRWHCRRLKDVEIAGRCRDPDLVY